MENNAKIPGPGNSGLGSSLPTHGALGDPVDEGRVFDDHVDRAHRASFTVPLEPRGAAELGPPALRVDVDAADVVPPVARNVDIGSGYVRAGHAEERLHQNGQENGQGCNPTKPLVCKGFQPDSQCFAQTCLC